jgi:L-seryl-tRNA(Ser) seleniumtransferase
MFLAMYALAADREVILSRGELVEIGGSFRVPEILEASRARLVEVGTTNRTHLVDYERAIGPRTGMLLKVHRSNFDVVGFTRSVELRELEPLAREHGLPLVEDRGSGTFVDLRDHGLPEPPVTAGLTDGADLVLFSGDKLLGGPQAGIALGRRELIDKMRSSPLARALRVDKLTLAALGWTLRVLLDGDGLEQIPTLRMLTAKPDDLKRRADRLAKAIAPHVRGSVSVQEQASLVGGGALPDFEMPGFCVRIVPGDGDGTVTALARRLRQADPPVLARIQRDAIVLDPRALEEDELDGVAAAFATPRFDSSI